MIQGSNISFIPACQPASKPYMTERMLMHAIKVHGKENITKEMRHKQVSIFTMLCKLLP